MASPKGTRDSYVVDG